jgi:hypothetical protein
MATFDEIVAQAAERLNIVGADGLARIGRNVNAYYKRVTSSLGIATARRTVVQATATMGVDLLTFAVTKLNHVEDRTVTPAKLLDQVSNEEIAEGSQGALATRYSIYSTTATTVTIRMDAIPQTAFVLYAEGLAAAGTLSGSDEPAFDESFHDILVSAAVYEERLKMEKQALAQQALAEYESRLGDLRMSIAISSQQDIFQGKRLIKSVGSSGSGSGSGTNGADSYTQTGLITFNRQPSLPPFAITAPSAKVANLDADLLDGQNGTDYHDASLLTGALADARLSSNVPLKNGTNAFTGANSFATNPLNLLVGQITFPAAQNASSNVNTLDDYEEGTWTPVLGGSGGTSGQTYATQLGTYVKIGKLVTVTFYIVLTNKGTITTTAQISGLPFANEANVFGSMHIGNWLSLGTNWVFLAGYIAPSTSIITINGIQAAAATLATLTTTDITNTTQLIGSATYRAAN